MDALAYQHTVEDMAFSPDGTILGVGLGVYGVEITELTDHTEPQRLGEGGFTSFNSRLAFSPDGFYIATGNREGIVWIWELDGLTQMAALESPDLSEKKYSDKMLLGIEYHPSGKLLAAMHIDGTISIWDVEKNEVTQSLQTFNHHNMFRFSPTGSEMACVVSDRGENLIQILAVEDGELLRDIVMPKRIKCLSFSPDGSLLAVASYGSPATIWDVASGDLIYTLDQEIEPLEDADYLDNSPDLLTFTDDGGHLAVTSRASKSNGMIELWRLPGAEPIAPQPVDMHMPPPLPGDVLFDTGSSALKQEAFVELEALAEVLYANFSKATITFVGHTDSRGDAQSNLQLSLDRAQVIKDWFQDWADEKGDLEWTLLVDGKGDSELKVQDEDVDGNFLNDAGALNRRVEIEIEA